MASRMRLAIEDKNLTVVPIFRCPRAAVACLLGALGGSLEVVAGFFLTFGETSHRSNKFFRSLCVIIGVAGIKRGYPMT
jgi:hypothetical protein